MRTVRDKSLISAAAAGMFALAIAILPAQAQTAADAALEMANMLDGAGGGVSSDDLLAALEDAAEAGQPMAMWQLGTMYENGEGVDKDPAKAFGYFSQIANQYANAPKGIESDIVAQSFVKLGDDYLRKGLPEAGIAPDPVEANRMLLHAADVFGEPEAQYRVGLMYLETDGGSRQHSARYFYAAANKGHAGAQARLGDLLFNGDGIEARPAEGLVWLSIAHRNTTGTADDAWVKELLTRAMSVATPEQRAEAIKMADAINLEPDIGL